MSGMDDVTEEEAMQLIAQLLDEVNVKNGSAIIEGSTTDGTKKFLLVEASLVAFDSLEDATAAASVTQEAVGARPDETIH